MVALASVLVMAATPVGPVGAEPIGAERPPDPRSGAPGLFGPATPSLFDPREPRPPRPTGPGVPVPSVGRTRGEQAAAMALEHVGAPYRWGGASPAGFDCSGFVLFVYAKVGVALPHGVLAQLAVGRRVAVDALLPGDVLVFRDTYRPGPSHSGIYLGDGRFVHASDERHGVTINSIREGSWAARLHGASRPGS